jgi:hypothetical protein
LFLLRAVILKIIEVAQTLGHFFNGISYELILAKMGSATVWAIFSQNSSDHPGGKRASKNGGKNNFWGSRQSKLVGLRNQKPVLKKKIEFRSSRAAQVCLWLVCTRC